MTEKQIKAVNALNRVHDKTGGKEDWLLTDDEYMTLLEIVMECEQLKIEYVPYYPYTIPNNTPFPYQPWYTTCLSNSN